MDSLKVGDVVLVKNRNIKGQYFKSKVAKIELATNQPPWTTIPRFDDSFLNFVFVNEVCWNKLFRVHLSCGYIALNSEIFPIEPMF